MDVFDDFMICSKCKNDLDESNFVGLLFLDGEDVWVDNFYHIKCNTKELNQNHENLVFASAMDCFNQFHQKYDSNIMINVLKSYKTIYASKNISTYVRVDKKNGITSIFTPIPYCFSDDAEFEKIVFFNNSKDITVERHNPDNTIDYLRMD